MKAATARTSWTTSIVGQSAFSPRLIGRQAVPEHGRDDRGPDRPHHAADQADAADAGGTSSRGTKNRQAALDNPQEFALQAARIIREKAIQQLVDGIQYEKDGTWYEMSEWVEEEETVSDRLVPVENSIYDHIVVQSETERKFVEKLKKRKDVRLFVKLPDGSRWRRRSASTTRTGAGDGKPRGLRRPSVSGPGDEEHDGGRRAAGHGEPEDPLRRAALRRGAGSRLQGCDLRRRPALTGTAGGSCLARSDSGRPCSASTSYGG